MYRQISAVLALAAMFASPLVAQQKRSSNLPLLGKSLPSVTAYDAAGQEFSLDSLRGDYSVIVFGCLT